MCGAIINDLNMDNTKSDSSIAAENLFNIHEKGLKSADIPGHHVKYLKDIGFEEDVKYALQMDTLDVLPFIKDGKIIN